MLCFCEPVLKARNNPDKRARRLSAAMERSTQIGFLSGLKRFRNRVSADTLMDAWKSGTYSHILATLKWEALPEDLSEFKSELRRTQGKSSEFTIEALPKPIKDNLRYDIKNPKLDRYVNTRTGELIVGIQSETQEIVQTIVRDSFIKASTPREVADRIKDSIGLHPRYENALFNYRKKLVEAGESQSRVEALTEDYRERLLTSRAMTVARTEVQGAINHGQLEVWRQAKDDGMLPEGTEKVWQTVDQACDICEPMDGVAVGIDEYWNLPSGQPVMLPTDSHPNCRCIQIIRMPK